MEVRPLSKGKNSKQNELETKTVSLKKTDNMI